MLQHAVGDGTHTDAAPGELPEQGAFTAICGAKRNRVEYLLRRCSRRRGLDQAQSLHQECGVLSPAGRLVKRSRQLYLGIVRATNWFHYRANLKYCSEANDKEVGGNKKGAL